MASASAIGAVQVATYAVLSTDAALLALAPGGVHNDIPDGEVYPHVLISRPTEKAWNTFGGPNTGFGRQVLLRTHIYSRYKGDSEACDILNRIVELLDFQPMTVAGFGAAMVEYEGARILVEAIDKIETRHAVPEFRVWVNQP
jgi:hypothetical protein